VTEETKLLYFVNKNLKKTKISTYVFKSDFYSPVLNQLLMLSSKAADMSCFING